MFFSTPHSQISRTYILPLGYDKKIHTLIQEQPKLHTILKTEAARSSILPIPTYKSTPWHIPEHLKLHECFMTALKPAAKL
jgi:hypothetical protein